MKPKIEIIGTGSELVTGKILDQNAGYAAARLDSFGFEVSRIVLIGDQPAMIRSALRQAQKRADAVLVTGGLGGTVDDLTVETAAKTFHRPLVLNKTLQNQVRRFLTRRGIPRDTTFEKMAWLPEGVELLQPRPEACGFLLNEKGKLFFFLPGIPVEMRRLLDRRIIPFLLQHYPGQEIIRQRKYTIFGLLEQEINEKLRDLPKQFDSVRIGFYPNFPEHHLTVAVRSPKARGAERLLDSIEKIVEERLSEFLITKNRQTLEEVIGQLLTRKKMTLSVAESCTGGLIGHRITNVPGSSAYFDRGVIVYSNRAKTELLGIPKTTLSRFGAVSKETALLMAGRVRKQSGSHLGLAVTGIAGPGGGTSEKPVGTVWIALSTARGDKAGLFHFDGHREQIKTLTAYTALNWVRRVLLNDTFLFSD
jgi:competence/damage-inducible protein CinA-like protein